MNNTFLIILLLLLGRNDCFKGKNCCSEERCEQVERKCSCCEHKKECCEKECDRKVYDDFPPIGSGSRLEQCPCERND